MLNAWITSVTFGRTDGQIVTISNTMLSHSYVRAKMNIGFMAYAARATIDYRRFWRGVSLWCKISSRRGHPSPTIFARLDRTVNMPYNFAAESFHIRKLCTRLPERYTFRRKNDQFAYLSPLRGLRGNVRCSSQSHWKARSRRSHNWTHFASCKGWGATSEYRLEIAVFEARGGGQLDPKFQVERTSLTNHSSCRKTRRIFLSYGLTRSL